MLRLFDGDSRRSARWRSAPRACSTSRPMRADDPLLATARTHRPGQGVHRPQPQPGGAGGARPTREAWDVLVVPLRSGDRDRGYPRGPRPAQPLGPVPATRTCRCWRRSAGTSRPRWTTCGCWRPCGTRPTTTRSPGCATGSGLHVEGAGCDRRRLGRRHRAGRARTCCPRSTTPSGTTAASGCCAMAGERLVELVGEGTPVARIEADRFAVLVDDQPEAELTAFGGRDAAPSVERPYSLDGIEVDPQPCVGIAVVRAATRTTSWRATAGSTPARCCSAPRWRCSPRRASRRRCRSTGRAWARSTGGGSSWSPSSGRPIEQGRIIVHYQPKVGLADRELVGVEALVRWMHPEFGLVSPAEFVEAIEATGSIDILLGHVLDIVLQQLRDWTATGHPDHRGGEPLGAQPARARTSRPSVARRAAAARACRPSC